MKALYAVLSPLKEGENGNKQGQIPTPQCHINKSIRWQDISLSHVIAGHDANCIYKKKLLVQKCCNEERKQKDKA